MFTVHWTATNPKSGGQSKNLNTSDARDVQAARREIKAMLEGYGWKNVKITRAYAGRYRPPTIIRFPS